MVSTDLLADSQQDLRQLLLTLRLGSCKLNKERKNPATMIILSKTLVLRHFDIFCCNDIETKILTRNKDEFSSIYYSDKKLRMW